MRKSFLVLIFLFFTFSILNAKPLKTEAELQNIRNKADKIVQEELKNDYKKEYLKRKNNLEKIEGIEESIFSDGEFVFELKNGVVDNISKNIEKNPDIFVTKAFDKDGNLLKIAFLAKLDEETFLYRELNKDLSPIIETYSINEKCIQKAYYSNKKLAYTREGKLVEGYNLLPNGKYTEYYKNGQIKVQGSYKEGKRDGEFKAFLKNGKSAGSVFYKDGKIIKSTLVNSMKDNASFSLTTDINYNLNSNEIITDEFPNGLLKQYFIYNKNGLLDGESREYYEEGDIKSISHFKNDIPDGVFISYYQNGNIENKYAYVNGQANGECFSYYENGKLEERYFLKNGEIDGEAFAYYPSGKLRGKEVQKLGKREGESIIYHENGNIKQKSTFKNDKREGDLFIYFPSGKLRQTEKYINGKIEGEVIEYYESGTIKEKAYFINDKQEKEHFFYDKKGKLIKTDIYKNGVKQ